MSSPSRSFAVAMRLLDTNTGQFEEKNPEETRYAILSHTWDEEGEQTYEQLRSIQRRYAPVSQTQQKGCRGRHEGSTWLPQLIRRESESKSRDPSSEPEVESGPPRSAQEHDRQNPSQRRSRVPEGSPLSSEQQETHGASPKSSRSPQLPPDGPSVTTPLPLQSTRSKSCFTRGMARLKTWLQCRAALRLPSGSPPDPRVAPRGRPSPEDCSGGPHPTPPPSQLLSDPPPPIPAPLTAIGPLTQSEVEALFNAFEGKHRLTNLISAPTPPAASAPAQGHQPDPPLKSIWGDPELSCKIWHACDVAQKNGYRYIWIDSCCIDKSSSSELSEAINSMYKWYGLAAVCYTYLADVPPREDHRDKESAFRRCKWFTRGWTLQELIAPAQMEFLSQDWTPIGSKLDLIDLVESITKINYKALLHLESLDKFSVAHRLSWAVDRKTTREEDRPYSLLGILDINMPTLYGEGNRAIGRLQEQIMQRIPDQSLFAWGHVYLSSQSSNTPPVTVHFEAEPWISSPLSPLDMFFWRFISSSGIRPSHYADLRFLGQDHHSIQYTSTLDGTRVQLPMIGPLDGDSFLRMILPAIAYNIQATFSFANFKVMEDWKWYLANLRCEHVDHPEHLLGQVCYIPPANSGVEFVYPGYVYVNSQPGESCSRPASLFPLSLNTISQLECGQQTKLKTVYIPNPDRTNLPLPKGIPRLEPCTTIRLALVMETRIKLASQGYLADLRNPDLEDPTTHWLTLFKDHNHTITIKFQHKIWDGGRQFSIRAEINMSESHVQPQSDTPVSSRMDQHTVSWWGRGWWTPSLSRKIVMFSAAAMTGPVVVSLKLDFAGTAGSYLLCVDAFSDEEYSISKALHANDSFPEEAGEREGPTMADHPEGVSQDPIIPPTSQEHDQEYDPNVQNLEHIFIGNKNNLHDCDQRYRRDTRWREQEARREAVWRELEDRLASLPPAMSTGPGGSPTPPGGGSFEGYVPTPETSPGLHSIISLATFQTDDAGSVVESMHQEASRDAEDICETVPLDRVHGAAQEREHVPKLDQPEKNWVNEE